MSTLSPIHIVVLGATAGVFAGCSNAGSLTPAGPQGGGLGQQTMLRSTAKHSSAPGFMSTDAKHAKKLLYMSDSSQGVVNVYSQKGSNQSPIGQITGLNFPSALVVAENGDLYVGAVQGSFTPVIYAYHKGDTMPYNTLTGSGSIGLAFDTKGNLYATQFFNTVNIFAAGSTVPTSTLSAPLCSVHDVAVDRKGNVFVDGFDCQPPPNDGEEVDMFPAGSTTPTKVISNISSSGGIAADSKNNLVVEDAGAGTVSVYAPPYTGAPKSTFSFAGTGVDIALTQGQANVWIAVDNAVSGLPEGREYNLKTGSLLDSTSTTDLVNAVGIAVSPPRKI